MKVTISEIGNRKVCYDDIVQITQKGHRIDIIDSDGHKMTEIESAVKKIELDGFEPHSSKEVMEKFENFLCQRNDDIENAAFELTKKMREKPYMEWNVYYATNIAEIAEKFLFEKGKNPCYPSFVGRHTPCYLADECSQCKFMDPAKKCWNHALCGSRSGLANNLFNALCCENVNLTSEQTEEFLERVQNFLKEDK